MAQLGITKVLVTGYEEALRRVTEDVAYTADDDMVVADGAAEADGGRDARASGAIPIQAGDQARDADEAEACRRGEGERPAEGAGDELVRRRVAAGHEPVDEVVAEDEVQEDAGRGHQGDTDGEGGGDADAAGAAGLGAVGSEDLHGKDVRARTMERV